MKGRPNNGMQRTALCAAADAEGVIPLNGEDTMTKTMFVLLAGIAVYVLIGNAIARESEPSDVGPAVPDATRIERRM